MLKWLCCIHRMKVLTILSNKGANAGLRVGMNLWLK